MVVVIGVFKHLLSIGSNLQILSLIFYLCKFPISMIKIYMSLMFSNKYVLIRSVYSLSPKQINGSNRGDSRVKTVRKYEVRHLK